MRDSQIKCLDPSPVYIPCHMGNTCTHMHTHTHVHTKTQYRPPTHTCARTHTHTHALMQAHISHTSSDGGVFDFLQHTQILMKPTMISANIPINTMTTTTTTMMMRPVESAGGAVRRRHVRSLMVWCDHTNSSCINK